MCTSMSGLLYSLFTTAVYDRKRCILSFASDGDAAFSVLSFTRLFLLTILIAAGNHNTSASSFAALPPPEVLNSQDVSSTPENTPAHNPAFPQPEKSISARPDSFRIGDRYFCDRGSQEFIGAVLMSFAFRTEYPEYQIVAASSYRYFPVKNFYAGPLTGCQLTSGQDIYLLGLLAGIASNRGSSVLFCDVGYQKIFGTSTYHTRERGITPGGYAIPANAGMKVPFNRYFAANLQISFIHMETSSGSEALLVSNGNIFTFGVGFSALLY